MQTRWAFLFLTLGLSATALAEPAPWYTWMSKVDSKIVCAQISPGAGWVRLGGPYRTARCSAAPRWVPPVLHPAPQPTSVPAPHA